MKEFLTKKTYNKGKVDGYRAGWKASLEKMQEMLEVYKDLDDAFAHYKTAMNDAIEIAEKLKGVNIGI
jgi:flagellar biosynthesis/type III secretory pathway protein FliH